MKLGSGRQLEPSCHEAPAGIRSDLKGTPATHHRRAPLVAAAIVLLSGSVFFLINYRFPIVPYLAVAVIVASFWRSRAGALCLAASVAVLVMTELRHLTWQDGLQEVLAFVLLGLVFVGTRAVLEAMERQRVTEQRLIAELSAAVEQLRESERQQALAAQAKEERTRELEAAHEQLLRSARLAALGQFSATIAHELRNPLNVIKLAAHYVSTHLPDPDEKLRRNLSHLNQYVDRAGDIINDLLTFSRLPPPKLEPTVMNDVIRTVIEALAVPERVTVELSLTPDLPPVMADTRQIEQALENLAQNALQAMPEGGRLAVGTRLAEDRVEIAVRDTGPGIPGELCGRIFEPFFSTKVSGTGLGLPLVLEIAVAHGGHCSLESAPGEGACFTLSLPLAAEAPHVAAPEREGTPAVTS